MQIFMVTNTKKDCFHFLYFLMDMVYQEICCVVLTIHSQHSFGTKVLFLIGMVCILSLSYHFIEFQFISNRFQSYLLRELATMAAFSYPRGLKDKSDIRIHF